MASIYIFHLCVRCELNLVTKMDKQHHKIKLISYFMRKAMTKRYSSQFKRGMTQLRCLI